jgi:uncharacterized protein
MKKIVIAGGTGYLGTVLSRSLSPTHEVVVLSRKPLCSFDSRFHVRFVHWDGQTLGPWIGELDGAEALINLAGKSVNCRYNVHNRQEIFDSRMQSTQVLAEAIGLVKNPPKVWLNSSTSTIYRHAEDRNQDEYTGDFGTDFSVQVAQLWEKTFFEHTLPATRQIALRTAIVLGRTEGVMHRLRRLVRFGLGGAQGHGSQFVSWIHEDDFVRAVMFLINDHTAEGVYNLTSPNPITNRFLMQTIRQTMGVGIGLPAPKWLLKIGAWLIGTETELILKSRRVVPTRLTEAGFEFEYSTIGLAIDQILRPTNHHWAIPVGVG